MTSWTCVIPGKPTPKGNSKSVLRFNNRLIPVQSKAVVAAENNAKAIAWTQRPHELLDGALAVDVDFVFAIPKSRAKKLKPGDPHVQRPDRGNCLKMIEDVLQGVAYADDSAVCAGVVRKVWGLVDQTVVTVRQLEEAGR